MNDVLYQIAFAWTHFNWPLGLIIFFAYVVVDALYAKYTLHVTRYDAFSAATIGALMHFILAFGVLNYVRNFLYVIPLAAGSWIGTYLIVKREGKKDIAVKKLA